MNEKNDARVKSWVEILILPLTIALVSGMITLYISEQQRASAEQEAKARLTLQYTEVFLAHYKDINDSNVRQVLYAVTGTMKEFGLPRGEEFYNLVTAPDVIKSENSKPSTEYKEQEPGDCGSKPTSMVCVWYADGYVWLVNDTILSWGRSQKEEMPVQIAFGAKALYYHVLNTNLIKKVVF